MNDSIYACGGGSPIAGVVDSCEKFTVTDDATGDGNWTYVPPLPNTTFALSMTVIKDRLYAIGGVKIMFI